jgi:NADP-dependent 3-hydroxy acid dehydrogenase YdfG
MSSHSMVCSIYIPSDVPLLIRFVGADQEPKKPSLDIIDVNLYGVLYTVKLAMHFFIKQNGTKVNPNQEDTCLVLIGSGAAFLDCPRGPQYSSTKWAMRGIMHSLRRTTFYYGSRINIISPWSVQYFIAFAIIF